MPLQSPALESVLPQLASLLIAAAGTTVALAAAFGLWTARGSTAVPAAIWAMVAGGMAGIWVAAGGMASGSPAAHACGRLVLAAVAVCPAMSLLGAKRPQHAVWQVIVGSLACVLALPALTAALVRPGSLPDVHLVSRGFLALVALAGWINFLGTRKAVAATLVTAGLLGFSRPFLPGVETARALSLPWADVLSGVAVMAGGIAAVGSATLGHAHPPPQGATRMPGAVNAPFLALRETLGAAWALRIAERFNRIAEERGWPCRLQLGGLDPAGDAAEAAWQSDAVNCFESIARRFVSRRWLLRHGGRAA